MNNYLSYTYINDSVNQFVNAQTTIHFFLVTLRWKDLVELEVALACTDCTRCIKVVGRSTGLHTRVCIGADPIVTEAKKGMNVNLCS